MTLDRVVVNAVAPPPPGADPARLRSVLESLPDAIGLRHVPEPPVLARCVEHLDSRHRLNAHYVEEIEVRTGLPTLRLPLIPRGVQDVDALRQLAEPLLAEPTRSADRPESSSAPGVRP
jgi:hypothetical protein